MKSSKLISLLLVTCVLFFVNDVQAISTPGNTQEQIVPKPIRKIVKALAKANLFVLNKSEQPSLLVTEQEKNYLLLSRLATSNELEDLIRTHKNAVVRMYAFKALTTQVHDIPASTMTIINNDTTTIECINRDKTERVELKKVAQNFLN